MICNWIYNYPGTALLYIMENTLKIDEKMCIFMKIIKKFGAAEKLFIFSRTKNNKIWLFFSSKKSNLLWNRSVFFARDNGFFNPVNSTWDPLISMNRDKKCTLWVLYWIFKVKNSKFNAVNEVLKPDLPYKFFHGRNFRPHPQVVVDNFVPLTKNRKKTLKGHDVHQKILYWAVWSRLPS